MTMVAPHNRRTFFVIWLGQVISILGSGLTSFGLAVWIFEQTGAATPFALTVLFGNLPTVLLSPLAGPLVDRWNRRLVMIGADMGSALLTIGAFFLLASGRLEIWHIYLVAALASSLSAFQEPAYTASVSLLVPEKDLARASGLLQMGQALQMLVAPLLAGFLYVLIGLEGIVLIDLLTFVAAIGALLLVRIPQPAPDQASPGGEKPSLWREALFGWRYLWVRPGLLGLLTFFALVNFCLNFAAVLLGPMVLSFSSPSALGTVQALGGVGMLAGSIAMSAWGGLDPGRRTAGIFGFIVLGGTGLFISGLAPLLWVVSAGFFLLMFAVPFGSGMSQALFQSKVAPEVQGRVFATRTMISRSMMPLAFLLAGPLADGVFEPLMRPGGALARGPLGALLGAGPGRGIGLLIMLAALLLLVASAVAWSSPRIRNLEAELPDMLPAAAAEAEPADRPAVGPAAEGDPGAPSQSPLPT